MQQPRPGLWIRFVIGVPQGKGPFVVVRKNHQSLVSSLQGRVCATPMQMQTVKSEIEEAICIMTLFFIFATLFIHVYTGIHT